MKLIARLICRFLLWLFGWKAYERMPKGVKKNVMLVVPHTSNWDFVVCIALRSALHIESTRYLAKVELFRSPIGFLMRWLGGTPVDRSKNTSLVQQVADEFDTREQFSIAITPEGTRSRVEKWKMGFYHIALKAKVPIALAYADFHKKEGGIGKILYPSGNMTEDMAIIEEFYKKKLPLYRKNSSLNHIEGKTSLFNPFKTGLKLLLLGLLIWVALNFSMIWYGIRQAHGQINIIYRAKPIATYLKDPNYPEVSKKKIRLIEQIRRFAFDSIGLDPSDSYTKLYDQQGKPILWLLTACEAFSLQPKVWHFPLLGSFSYKSFFDLTALQKEEKKLRNQGYDTYIREVNAWSTLGILNDPILSSMLKSSAGSLANTIIHELTHGTLFIKDKLSYNENMASFVGDVGAEKFLKYQFGAESPQYHRYVSLKTDRHRFASYVLEAAHQLESLYQSFDENQNYDEKISQKNAFINRFVKAIDTVYFDNGRYYQYFDYFLPNNNFFLSYRRYRAKRNQFQQEFEQEFNQDFKTYFKYLKTKCPSIF